MKNNKKSALKAHVQTTYSVNDCPQQSHVINGVSHIRAITLVHPARAPQRRMFAVWNCGWHVAGKILTHAQFNKAFTILTNSEQKRHMASPDSSSKTWRRSTDHIWFIHEQHGNVVCRIHTGITALIEHPDTGLRIGEVSFHSLTESAPFKTFSQPLSKKRCHKTARVPGVSKAKVNQFLGMTLDELL